MEQNRNSLILKNSIYLYIRAIVSLFLKLITTKLVVEALGVNEYGVFQVIGGVVTMFAFLNSTLSGATIRFLAFEIGKGDENQTKRVFSTAIMVHFILAIIIFFAIETIGIYTVKSGYIQLGNVSISTAIWVLHFTAFSTVFNITSVPYNSLILAKEDMAYYAYIDLLGVFLNFVLGCSLSLFQSERLIYYAFLTFAISFIVRLVYILVCHKNYQESHFHLIWDKTLLKKMTSFSAWTSLSSISYMIRNQGLTIIVNYFFGPILNAAVGISNQVNQGVKTFSVNFQAAFSSQITKNYAQRLYNRMEHLVVSGAKLSTYLMLIVSIPIILECDYILRLWLSSVPSHTDVIIILFLLETIISTMTCTGNVAIRATGKIKYYEQFYNIVYLLSIPVMIIWFLFEKEYYIPFVTILVFVILSTVVKLFFISNSIPGFNLKKYIYEIFLLIPSITLLSMIVPLLLHYILNQSIMRFVVSTLSFELFFFPLILLFGLNNKEKELIMSKLKLVFKGHVQ